MQAPRVPSSDHDGPASLAEALPASTVSADSVMVSVDAMVAAEEIMEVKPRPHPWHCWCMCGHLHASQKQDVDDGSSTSSGESSSSGVSAKPRVAAIIATSAVTAACAAATVVVATVTGRLRAARSRPHAQQTAAIAVGGQEAQAEAADEERARQAKKAELAAEAQHDAMQVEALLTAIREHGRQYELGGILLTFGELRELPQLSALDVPVVLARAVAAHLITLDNEDGEEGGEATSCGEDAVPAAALLVPGDDDDVTLTAVAAVDAQGGSKPWEAKPWRRGSFVPFRAIAPLVDLDDGDLNYVVIRAMLPDGGDEVMLIRGFAINDCPFHADVLDQAATTLVSAGYSRIRCVGGGQMRHCAARASLLIAGTSQSFGTADHSATKALCTSVLGPDYAVSVQDVAAGLALGGGAVSA